MKGDMLFHAGEGEDHAKKPLVVLIGWLLSKPQHLSKFSSWYNQNGFDTISLLPKPGHVVSIDQAGETAKHLLDSLTSPLLESRPIVVHGFSVGGYLYGRLLMEIETAGLQQSFSARISAQVFDSPVDVDGVPHGVSVAMTTMKPAQRIIKGSLDLFLSSRPKTSLVYRKASAAFKNNALRTPTHVFYSKADVVACPVAIESVMQGWRQFGVPVTSTHWTTSPHVLHMVKDRDRYFQDLQTFLSGKLPPAVAQQLACA